MKKTFELVILNQKFSIKSDDDEKHVKKVFDLVNKKTHELMSSNPSTTALNVAILTALNIADEFFKQKKGLEHKTEEWMEKVKEIMNRLETDPKL